MSVNVDALRATVEAYGMSTLEETLLDLKRQAWDAAPVDTGATRDYLRVIGPMANGNNVVGTIETPAPQAKWQDEGTRPHKIHGNPFLAFQIGGKTIIVREVNHPGSRHYVGWFSDVMTLENFIETLTRVIVGNPAFF